MEKFSRDIKTENEIFKLKWIKKNGSERLKRCVKENIVCDAIFRDEYLFKEAKGWVHINNTIFKDVVVLEARNPPMSVFNMLDKARAAGGDLTKNAVLKYFRHSMLIQSYAAYLETELLGTIVFLGNK